MKRSFFLLVGLLGLAGTALHGTETVTTLNFSDPSKPCTLKLSLMHGEVRIRGDATAQSVTVKSEASPEKSAKARSDGLRVISTTATFSFSESNNVVTLDYGREGRRGLGRAEFDVTVPVSTSIIVRSEVGAEVVIEDVNGDVEVKSMNGEVVLRRLGGGALVESMNGEISAEFARLPNDKPISFTSMNGDVTVRLPGDAKANVRFRTQNGSILTDFDENVLKTRTELTSEPASLPERARAAAQTAKITAERVGAEARAAAQAAAATITGNESTPRPPKAPRAPSIPAVVGGKVVSGSLNGGGADVQIATMNGDIIVRKAAP